MTELRRLIVTWPEPGEHVSAMRLEDADTGERLNCVTYMTVTADCNTRSDDDIKPLLSAILTMVCNAEGGYARKGEPVAVDPDTGAARLKTMRWLVAEMRTS